MKSMIIFQFPVSEPLTVWKSARRPATMPSDAPVANIGARSAPRASAAYGILQPVSSPNAYFLVPISNHI